MQHPAAQLMHHVVAGKGVEMTSRWRKSETVQGESAQSCGITGEEGAEMIKCFALVQMAAAAGLVGLRVS